jgi:hypothetical protein
MLEVLDIMGDQHGVVRQCDCGNKSIHLVGGPSLLPQKQAQTAVGVCACLIKIGDGDNLKKLLDSFEIFRGSGRCSCSV